MAATIPAGSDVGGHVLGCSGGWASLGFQLEESCFD